MDTQRKFAVVTGASSGIGYYLAKECAEHGCNLLIAADVLAWANAATGAARPGGGRRRDRGRRSRSRGCSSRVTRGGAALPCEEIATRGERVGKWLELSLALAFA